jgi:hypothetical protein
MQSRTHALSVLAVLLLTIPAGAQEAARRAVIWYDRGDPATLNLLAGPGGRDREPGTDFRFVKESVTGTSPKFEAEDENGVTWKVKVGEEVHGETAAARLLWAVGYVVDEDYFRPQIHVRGMKPLKRGQQFVSADGLVTDVRLERNTSNADSSAWSWYDNPLLGTREFNGLRVMMALINNWDLKAVNNSAAAAAGSRVYSISDLGSSFGRTGDALRRSKSVATEYAESRFIDDVTPTHVDFVLHSRPFFPTVVNLRNYRVRTRMESIVKDIPLADARWIGGRLSQLSATQIGDCFRAGGFAPEDVALYTQTVMRRVAALRDLPAPALERPVAEAAPARPATTTRLVPIRETLIAIPVGTPHAGAVAGGFEQGGGLGVGAQLTTAHVLPAVELRAMALTSTHKAQRYELDAAFSHVGSRRTHADIWFTYLQRATDFHSSGAESFPDRDTQFSIERRSYQGSLSRDLTDRLHTGIYAQARNTRSVLDESTRSTIRLYGAFLSFDTRDNSRGLTTGVNLFARFATADGLGAVSDRYGWTELEGDARAYIPLGGPRTSLLVRSLVQFKSPQDGREIPFYDLSWLGGRMFLRGTPSYRLRGNDLLLLASELQRTIVPLTRVRGVDLFASGDAGQTWTDRREFTRSRWRSGLGGGVQYRHSQTMAVRVETSHGVEGVQSYASLSRGF